MIDRIAGASDAKRILVIKTSSLGDVCNALPAVHCIKEHKPEAEIGWVVKNAFKPIISASPFVGRVHSFPRKSLMKAIRLGLALRQHKYEVSLDMQSLFVSGLIAKLSGAKYRICYDTRKEGSHLLNNYPIIPARKRDRRAVEVMLDFAGALGIEKPFAAPQTWLAEAKAAEAKEMIRGVPRPYAALFVGATTPQRQWSHQRWARLADMLFENGITSLFVGAEPDGPATVSARSQMKYPSFSIIGESDLLTLAAVLGEAAVAVGGDTGPLHMAAVIGTPVMGLYGPTDPATTGPFGDYARSIYIKQPCSPCYRKPTCGGSYFCMAAIEAASVSKNVMKLLSEVDAK